MKDKLDELARSFGDISSTYSIAADLASSPEDARLFDALANAYDEARAAVREVRTEEDRTALRSALAYRPRASDYLISEKEENE